MEELAGMEGALAFLKQTNSMGRQAGGIYWYLTAFFDNHINHFMQLLSQNYRRLMTTFSVNRSILCERHKTDDVCLRLTQQVCCNAWIFCWIRSSQSNRLNICLFLLLFIFSLLLPSHSSAAHVCFTICWPKLKLEQDFLTSYMFLTLPWKITTKMQQHSCHQLYICLKSYRLGTRKSTQNHLQHKNKLGKHEVWGYKDFAFFHWLFRV